MESDKPVPGLYAAGEAVGNPHGASRLGSCAIPDCLVFGRICGKTASKENA
ncbi:MAG: FAD-binding protein [Desulfomonilia bacterium]